MTRCSLVASIDGHAVVQGVDYANNSRAHAFRNTGGTDHVEDARVCACLYLHPKIIVFSLYLSLIGPSTENWCNQLGE